MDIGSGMAHQLLPGANVDFIVYEKLCQCRQVNFWEAVGSHISQDYADNMWVNMITDDLVPIGTKQVVTTMLTHMWWTF